MKVSISHVLWIPAALLLFLWDPSAVAAQGAQSLASCAGCEENTCVLGCPVGNPGNCSSVCVDGEGWCHYHPGEGCGGGSTEPDAFIADGTAFSLAFTRFDRAKQVGAEQSLTRTVALNISTAPTSDHVAVFRRPCDRAVVGRQYSGAVIEKARAETRVLNL